MACRKRLLAREVSIIRRMRQKLRLTVGEIALATDRNKSTIYKALDKSWKETKRGRPETLSKADTDKLVQVLTQMQKQAQVGVRVGAGAKSATPRDVCSVRFSAILRGMVEVGSCSCFASEIVQE